MTDLENLQTILGFNSPTAINRRQIIVRILLVRAHVVASCLFDAFRELEAKVGIFLCSRSLWTSVYAQLFTRIVHKGESAESAVPCQNSIFISNVKKHIDNLIVTKLVMIENLLVTRIVEIFGVPIWLISN